MGTTESAPEKYLEYGQESVGLNSRSAEKRHLSSRLNAPIYVRSLKRVQLDGTSQGKNLTIISLLAVRASLVVIAGQARPAETSRNVQRSHPQVRRSRSRSHYETGRRVETFRCCMPRRFGFPRRLSEGTIKSGIHLPLAIAVHMLTRGMIRRPGSLLSPGG